MFVVSHISLTPISTIEVVNKNRTNGAINYELRTGCVASVSVQQECSGVAGV